MALMNLKHEIARLVKKALHTLHTEHASHTAPSTIELSEEELIAFIEIPPEHLGDYALPCFSFARALKKSPQTIALELKDVLATLNLKEDHRYFDLIINTGPYLNFHINKESYSEYVLSKILEEQTLYGAVLQENPSVVLIESPGPNTNKPLHPGHLRNMLLGQSLYNLFKFVGKDVHIVNVINDRGVHICKSMLAYQKLGNNATPESAHRKPDHFVGDYYVKYAQLEKENPEIEKEIQTMLLQWEQGDPEIHALWKKMNAWAYAGWAETFTKLNFKIEKDYYESETYLHGKDIIMGGLTSELFQKDEQGAIYFDLEQKGLGKKILLRADGTSVYITQDIYLAKKRYEDFAFDELVYIVGNEQEYHFKVLFEIFRALEWSFADKCYHFSYGMVELPEGKIKSREGSVVDTDNIIEQVLLLATQEIQKRYPALSETELNERANHIAFSAMRFFFLKYDPLKNFVFNPKESLAFDGETGPYVQYSYARINSIFKKSEITRESIASADVSALKEKNEWQLIRKLDQFPAMIEDAALHFKPSTVAHYLIDLAQAFNEFYHANQVISAEPAIRDARLKLLHAIQIVLKIGLNILGIVAIEEM